MTQGGFYTPLARFFLASSSRLMGKMSGWIFCCCPTRTTFNSGKATSFKVVGFKFSSPLSV